MILNTPCQTQNELQESFGALKEKARRPPSSPPPPFHTPALSMRNTAELTDLNLPAQRHPNLNLTPEEKRVFFQLFQAADTTNLGVITGEIAVPFFEKTHLSPDTLGLVCGYHGCWVATMGAMANYRWCRYGKLRIKRTGVS